MDHHHWSINCAPLSIGSSIFIQWMRDWEWERKCTALCCGGGGQCCCTLQRGCTDRRHFSFSRDVQTAVTPCTRRRINSSITHVGCSSSSSSCSSKTVSLHIYHCCSNIQSAVAYGSCRVFAWLSSDHHHHHYYHHHHSHCQQENGQREWAQLSLDALALSLTWLARQRHARKKKEEEHQRSEVLKARQVNWKLETLHSLTAYKGAWTAVLLLLWLVWFWPELGWRKQTACVCALVWWSHHLIHSTVKESK